MGESATRHPRTPTPTSCAGGASGGAQGQGYEV